MAKEIQSRLPNPQRSLTSLYSRPNATGPQAPAPLARPSTTNSEMQIGSALMNLVQPVTQYGVKREQQEIEMLQQQEALKIDKMNIEEQRNYLAKLAREAEQYGTIARGSNFFRIKFAQEHAAAQIMQNSYQDALSKQINKFSDPMAPQDDSAQFALDTFQTMQFPGFYAQVKATEMYEKMSSNFQTEVRRRKGERMEKLNEQDAHAAFYTLWDSKLDANSDVEYTAKREAAKVGGATPEELEKMEKEWLTQGFEEITDNQYTIFGDSGHDRSLSALSSLVKIKTTEAAKLGELNTLDNLDTLVEGLRDTYGAKHTSTLDALDAEIDMARKTIENRDQDDIDEDYRTLVDSFYAFIYENSQEDAPLQMSVDYASPFMVAFRSRPELQSIDSSAWGKLISENIPALISKDAISSGRSNTADKQKADALSQDETLTLAGFEATISALDLSKPDRESATNSFIRTKQKEEMDAGLFPTNAPVYAKQLEDIATNVTALMEKEYGEPSSLGGTLLQTLLDEIKTELRDIPSADALQIRAKDLGEKITSTWDSIVGTQGFNIEEAEARGIHNKYPDIYDAMKKLTEKHAQIATLQGVDAEAVTEQGFLNYSDVGLPSGGFWTRMFRDNPDNIPGAIRSGDLEHAGVLGQQSHVDAMNFIKERTNSPFFEYREDGMWFSPSVPQNRDKPLGMPLRPDKNATKLMVNAIQLMGIEEWEKIQKENGLPALDYTQPEFSELFDTTKTLYIHTNNESMFIAALKDVGIQNGKGTVENTSLYTDYKRYLEVLPDQNKAVSFPDFLHNQSIGILNYTGMPRTKAIRDAFKVLKESLQDED